MAPCDEHEYTADFVGLADLARAFAELVSAPPEGGLVACPELIVSLAARCMPRSQHVALAVADHDGVHTVAATSDVPIWVDRIRASTGEGPALDALDAGDPVVSGDLAADPRWPLFGPRVADDTDLRSLVSYRLYLPAPRRAALSFYSSWPYAFDELAVTAGAMVAAYGTLILDLPVRSH